MSLSGEDSPQFKLAKLACPHTHSLRRRRPLPALLLDEPPPRLGLLYSLAKLLCYNHHQGTRTFINTHRLANPTQHTRAPAHTGRQTEHKRGRDRDESENESKFSLFNCYFLLYIYYCNAKLLQKNTYLQI